MNIIYDVAQDPWEYFLSTLDRVIRQEAVRSVCDIGGGSRPVFSDEEIHKLGLAYTVLDISAAELEKTPAGYRKICADICSRDMRFIDEFDLVFSRMLAEHIREPAHFHANVFRMLKPGGIAIHFFPTLYALPFIANRLLPESLARRLFSLFACQNPACHAKFPAYYRWCRGPTPRQVRRLTGIGFEIETYWASFRHAYYRRIPVLRQLQGAWSRMLLRHPNPHVTSYALVILRKPAGTGSGKKLGVRRTLATERVARWRKEN